MPRKLSKTNISSVRQPQRRPDDFISLRPIPQRQSIMPSIGSPAAMILPRPRVLSLCRLRGEKSAREFGQSDRGTHRRCLKPVGESQKVQCFAQEILETPIRQQMRLRGLNCWLQFFAVKNFQIAATMTHVTKQMMMRKTPSVQRLVLAGSSVDNEAHPPFTKSRNMPLPLPILVSPIDLESLADLLPTVRRLLLDDYRSAL